MAYVWMEARELMAATTGAQGSTCDNCNTSEARCAWNAGCCANCTHSFGVDPRFREGIEWQKPERPPLTLVKSQTLAFRAHALDLTDPLDRLYLELLPIRITTPEAEQVVFAPPHPGEIAALVNEVCPPNTGGFSSEAVA